MNAILAPGTLLHRRYEILKLLGQGDFGVVYRARDRRGASPPSLVAVKQMPVQMIVDCKRQADLLETAKQMRLALQALAA